MFDSEGCRCGRVVEVFFREGFAACEYMPVRFLTGVFDDAFEWVRIDSYIKPVFLIVLFWLVM